MLFFPDCLEAFMANRLDQDDFNKNNKFIGK